MAMILARKSLVSLLMFMGLVGTFEGMTHAQECDATYSAELKGTGDTYEMAAFGDSVMWP